MGWFVVGGVLYVLALPVINAVFFGVPFWPFYKGRDMSGVSDRDFEKYRRELL
jgi:hypothetical protein